MDRDLLLLHVVHIERVFLLTDNIAMDSLFWRYHVLASVLVFTVKLKGHGRKDLVIDIWTQVAIGIPF